MIHSQLWCIPNLLSLSRIPLAALVCLCIHLNSWPAAFVLFILAAITDWADGWWARRYGPQTELGRSLDPLTDKVLIAACFIFLIPVVASGVQPWMVAVVVIREILITALRGLVEAAGQKFPADWFGKLKTVLQCAVLIGVFLQLSLTANELPGGDGIRLVTLVLLGLMLLATVGSAVQYVLRAITLLRRPRSAPIESP